MLTRVAADAAAQVSCAREPSVRPQLQQNPVSLARETRREPFVGCARGDVTKSVRVAPVGVLVPCAYAVWWRVMREHLLTRAAVVRSETSRTFPRQHVPPAAIGAPGT